LCWRWGKRPLFAWLSADFRVGGGAQRFFMGGVAPAGESAAVEKGLHSTPTIFAALLLYLITGGSGNAFFVSDARVERLSIRTLFRWRPNYSGGGFLSSPGLWIGLAFAAVLYSLPQRVRLRRLSGANLIFKGAGFPFPRARRNEP